MNFKRKVIVTIAVFVFALTTLVTTTFAWFSIAQSATVGDLELTVTNGGKLLVSVDGENYYDRLTPNLFGEYIKNGLALSDVTTIDLEHYYNSYEGDVAIANKDYLTFTLYFRCTDEEMNGLYLSNDVRASYNYDAASENNIKGTYAYSKGVSFKTPVTFQYAEHEEREKGSTATYYAQDALRIGFKELALDDDDERIEFASFIFDPSGNPDRGYGSQYGAVDFIKKYVDSYITAPVNAPETLYELTTFNYNYYAVNNNSLCATFQERTVGEETYYCAKVQVSIWLEGWDADCFDSIYNDLILIQFYFRSAIIAD